MAACGGDRGLGRVGRLVCVLGEMWERIRCFPIIIHRWFWWHIWFCDVLCFGSSFPAVSVLDDLCLITWRGFETFSDCLPWLDRLPHLRQIRVNCCLPVGWSSTSWAGRKTRLLIVISTWFTGVLCIQMIPNVFFEKWVNTFFHQFVADLAFTMDRSV